MRTMRGLFIGQLGRGQTSGMRKHALSRIGFDMAAVESGNIWESASYLARQFGERYGRGRPIAAFNQRVLDAVRSHRPAFVWAEKQTYLRAEILAQLKRDGVLTIHYNPDPYYSLAWKRNSWTDSALQQYDVLVVTKSYELETYRTMTPGQVIYSPLGYDPLCHVPAPERSPSHDVSFVGGWEPRRQTLLSRAALLPARVAIWGYGWRIAQGSRIDPRRALRLGRLAPGSPLYLKRHDPTLANTVRSGENRSGEIYGEGYAEAIAASAMSLGFLRTICADQHTTRTFEIPAMGGFMLADRSEEHASFFEEGKEAEYFGSEEEYLDKIRFYLKNDRARRLIAASGYRRCRSSGYSYDDRLRAVAARVQLRPRAHAKMDPLENVPGKG